MCNAGWRSSFIHSQTKKSTIGWDWVVPTFPVIVNSCREKVKRWQTSGHYCWEGNKHPNLIGEVNNINSHKSTRFPGSFGLPQEYIVYISKPYTEKKLPSKLLFWAYEIAPLRFSPKTSLRTPCPTALPLSPAEGVPFVEDVSWRLGPVFWREDFERLWGICDW